MKNLFFVLICAALTSCGNNNGGAKSSANGRSYMAAKNNKILPIKSVNADDLRIITNDQEINLRVDGYDAERGEVVFSKLTNDQIVNLLQKESIEVEYRIAGLELKEGLSLVEFKAKTNLQDLDVAANGDHLTKTLNRSEIVEFVAERAKIKIESVNFTLPDGNNLTINYPEVTTCEFGLLKNKPQDECANKRVLVKNIVQKKVPVTQDETVEIIQKVREAKVDGLDIDIKVNTTKTKGTYRSISMWGYKDTELLVENFFEEKNGIENSHGNYNFLEKYTKREFISLDMKNQKMITVGLMTDFQKKRKATVVLSNKKAAKKEVISYVEDYQLGSEMILLEY